MGRRTALRAKRTATWVAASEAVRTLLAGRGPISWRTRHLRERLWSYLWLVAFTWWGTSLAFAVWLRATYPVEQLTTLIDARLYRLASLAWLEGRDPWGDLGLHKFAAPPPALAFMAPFALIPEAVAMPIFAALSIAAAVLALRALRLGWFWMAWPPLVGALIIGSVETMMVCLVIAGAGPLAPMAKIYALVPLIGERRWRAIAGAGLLLVVSAPFLPWALYIERLPVIAETMAEQAQDLSAWGTWLLPIVLLALFSLGPRIGGWLAVPAAWPLTQLHYALLALPIARHSPVLALGLSLPVPLAAPLSVIVYAVGRRIGWSSPPRDQVPRAHQLPPRGRSVMSPEEAVGP